MDTVSLGAQDEVMTSGGSARRATTADAAVGAQLLHDFNTEFPTPTPDAGELQSRLTLLLGSALLDAALVLVRDRGGALVEINVDGEDTDARRFYESHGFTNTEPNQTDPMLYYYREL